MSSLAGRADRLTGVSALAACPAALAPPACGGGPDVGAPPPVVVADDTSAVPAGAAGPASAGTVAPPTSPTAVLLCSTGICGSNGGLRPDPSGQPQKSG